MRFETQSCDIKAYTSEISLGNDENNNKCRFIKHAFLNSNLWRIHMKEHARAYTHTHNMEREKNKFQETLCRKGNYGVQFILSKRMRDRKRTRRRLVRGMQRLDQKRIREEALCKQ